MTPPEIVRTVAELRARVGGRRTSDRRIALVPTMGALHAGHISLARLARAQADVVVVSIFVNPTQFAAHEDLDRYPRTLDEDVAKLASDGSSHLVFAPAAADMYPHGFATRVRVSGVAEGLESDARPHFFEGVATVVAKLLLQAAPDVAVFGEKDYQQLLVVRRLVRDLDIPVEIVAGPTLREQDGLALSSRNAYLSDADRRIAPALHRSLQQAAAAVREGMPIPHAIRAAYDSLRATGFESVDYLSIRDAETLAPIDSLVRPARALAAARIGGTRLIDNIAV